TFGGSGSSRSVTIRPATNQSGTATITITVSDGSLSASSAFLLTVTAVNDAPTISAISGQVTQVGTPITVNFQINDVDNPVSSLTLSGQSTVPTLVPNSNIVFGGSGNNRSATITPLAGQSGDTTITLTVSDGTLQNSSSFVLSVIQPTPQSPTDILLSSNVIPENSTNGTLIGTLSAVDPDSANHVFALLDSAGGRFRIQGNQLLVDNGELLDFETASSHTILVKATDPEDLAFSKTLTIEVLNVNEAPVFVVADPSVIEAVAGQDTPINRLQLNDVDAGANAMILRLSVDNGILTVDTNFPVMISDNGTAEVSLVGSQQVLNELLASTNGLLYRPVENMSGTDLLHASLDDNGHTGTGGPQIVYTVLGIRFYESGFEQWIYTHFTGAELDNPEGETTLWGPNADPDGDGLENLAEYGLGTSPREPNSKPGAIFVSKNDSQHLSLQLNRRKDPNLLLSVAVSSEVNEKWSSSEEDLETFEPVDLGNGFEQVRFDDRTAATDSARRFMRMRWTLQHPTARSSSSDTN
ncbi:MAG: Ig-like domain-containing protein, partial [Limisphaerales bacterium]